MPICTRPDGVVSSTNLKVHPEIRTRLTRLVINDHGNLWVKYHKINFGATILSLEIRSWNILYGRSNPCNWYRWPFPRWHHQSEERHLGVLILGRGPCAVLFSGWLARRALSCADISGRGAVVTGGTPVITWGHLHIILEDTWFINVGHLHCVCGTFPNISEMKIYILVLTCDNRKQETFAFLKQLKMVALKRLNILGSTRLAATALTSSIPPFGRSGREEMMYEDLTVGLKSVTNFLTDGLKDRQPRTSLLEVFQNILSLVPHAPTHPPWWGTAKSINCQEEGAYTGEDRTGFVDVQIWISAKKIDSNVHLKLFKTFSCWKCLENLCS